MKQYTNRTNKTARTNKTGRNISEKKKRVFTKKHYSAGDGMVTSVWGPALWHSIHTISFNYPVNPSIEDKRKYRQFMLNLVNVLPCKYCRDNLKKNYKAFPLSMKCMKNRDSFSRYVYKLHETVNKLLGKKSGLSYCEVRERYEHFRARCTLDKPKMFQFNKTRKNGRKEKGCTEPLYGKKSKCIIKIVPQEEKCKTFQLDEKCKKKYE
tara:strand:+ start:11800 stop:12426 length:627 start_codon:yes stop_codon:yes gene_type:complete